MSNDIITRGTLVNLDSKVSPAILASIMGVNVSLIYQEKQKGVYGDPGVRFEDQTYMEVIKAFRNYHAKNTEYKLAKLEEDRKLKELQLEQHQNYKNKKLGGSSEVSEKLAVLQIKQIEQKIRTDRIAEIKGWLSVAEIRKELLVASSLMKLIYPFVNAIKNKLVSISMQFPETRDFIDESLNDLADMGETMLKHCGEDDKIFVDEMMNKNLEDDLLELEFIPSNLEV